jgi:hypothetical protein
MLFRQVLDVNPAAWKHALSSKAAEMSEAMTYVKLFDRAKVSGQSEPWSPLHHGPFLEIEGGMRWICLLAHNACARIGRWD